MTNNIPTGLGPEQVEESRRRYGVNVITPPKRESAWRLYIDKFRDPIIRILLVAALLSLAVAFIDGQFVETIGIICAIFLATGVSFWFEYDAKKRFEILNTVSDDVAVKVIRAGKVAEIPRRDVVAGDIVVLESGQEVPADGRLLEAVSLRINESALTGEPVVSKYTDPQRFDPQATYPSDRVMRGTTVAEGYGTMEADAVGDSTEYGRVAMQSTIDSGEKTPLTLQLERLSKLIGRVGTVLAVAIFAVMVVKDLFLGGGLQTMTTVEIVHDLLRFFMISVAVMVMAIPEGLPMSISLSLAISMRKMLKTNNLVRKLHACETMGAVTVICTDKTGTLTRNEMTVHAVERCGEPGEELLYESMAVNSTADLDENGKVLGNPTEGALLLWLRDRGEDYREIRRQARPVDRITFSTERKYMATVAEGRDGVRRLYVKGAPEIVRAMCAPDRCGDALSVRLRAFQDKAMRTLGIAWADASDGRGAEEIIRDGRLTFAAAVAISDPVREDVPAAVEECRRAGIDIKIVTGDTPATAREIARQIGLWDDRTDSALNELTGPEFAAMTDAELLERVEGLKIMARARPMDKQRLVQLLQKRGEVVAVTGDGTNDAPALNFAQVGLSMGSGTSVAKEASDITLLDDSFGTIATAVLWGRSLYRNIQRFVLFQLTINFAAIVVVFTGSLLGGALPLTVTQILWVNLIMDTFAAMAFASLPPDPKLMKEKPRSPSEFIITRPMAFSIFTTGLVFVAVLLAMLLRWDGGVTIYEMSAFFTVFVMLQIWNMFNVRAFGTPGSVFRGLARSGTFLAVAAGIFAGQVLIVLLGDGVFRTVPLSARDWALIVGLTALILPIGDLIRWLGRKIWKR